MNDIIIAVGFIFVFEGLLYSLFPKFMKNMMAAAISQPESNLRMAGLIALLIGTIIIYMIK